LLGGDYFFLLLIALPQLVSSGVFHLPFSSAIGWFPAQSTNISICFPLF